MIGGRYFRVGAAIKGAFCLVASIPKVLSWSKMTAEAPDICLHFEDEAHLFL